MAWLDFDNDGKTEWQDVTNTFHLGRLAVEDWANETNTAAEYYCEHAELDAGQCAKVKDEAPALIDEQVGFDAPGLEDLPDPGAIYKEIKTLLVIVGALGLIYLAIKVT